MIKVKDGYGKLVGDSYNGNANVMLVSDGSDVEKSITSKANTLVERNASGQIESSIATGTAPFVVTSTTKVTNLNADLLDGKHSTEFLTDDKLFTMLVPTGTAIPANADLQTTEYLKVGRYYCSANATAITLKNCPIDKAFMMEVYSPLSTTIDNETTSSYVYRLRKITHYNTGVQYWQYVGSSATAGSFTYGDWYVMPMSLHATNVNASGGSSSLGSKTKPVYIDNTGRFALGNEYYSISDVYNKTEIDDMLGGVNGSIEPPGDGTITIKQNEVVVGSFTMNQNTSDEINLINTTYEIFTGATASTDGTFGLVPMPIKGDDVKYLKGDGTWSTLGNASSADTITTNPVLEAVNNEIRVTVGGKTSNELTVPFATNSTNSDKIYTSNELNNSTHYITFVSGNLDDYKDLKQNTNLTYNPYDGVLNSSGINVTNLTSTNIAATNIYIGSSKLEEIFAPIIHYHDYLPLSGGTLTPVNSNTPLNLKGTSSSLDSWLAFQNNNGYLASIGVNSTKSLQYYDGTASYAIYHAGNFPTQKFKINDVTYNIYTSDTVTNFTIYAPTSKGEAGQYLINDGSGITWKTIDPYDYNIKRNTNTVLAGPVSGNSASATFRLLDISDIPDLSTLYLPLTGGTLTGNVTIEKASTGDCMYWTKVTDSGFTPELGFGTRASKDRGIYDSIKGWILKIDTNDIVTFEGKSREAFYADAAGEVPWTGVTGKPDCYNPCAHQHLTDDIINLTGYTAITELPELTPNLITSDTLNQALAKLEYKANNGQAAYLWYRSVTEENDSDAIVNKWQEIVNFIDSVAENTDITEEFVTTKTAQNVEGVKLFLGTMYFGNTVEFFHPVTFHSDIILSEASAVIGNIQLGHTDDAIDYVIKPSTDQYSMIGLPDRQFYQMYALEFCEDGTPLASKYATISHTSSAATYGLGSTSVYGHVKISNGDVDTVSHSNGLVAGMDHTHSSIMRSTSITLPATAGWYRIATSNSGIQRCNGLFSIESTVANRHTTCILSAHTNYGITDATGITVLSCNHWTYAGISKARIVYHTSYSGRYAYLEVYQPYASAGVVTVKLFGNYGWTLLDSVTTGSIPSGYSNKEVTLSNNTIVASSFVGSIDTANKLGTTTIGSNSRPIYLNSGSPTACTWDTYTSTPTAYYLTAATSTTSGLAYNTNIQVKSNAIYASGGFFESSDETLKNFENKLDIDFNELSRLKKNYFTWKDSNIKERQIGVSAQEIQKLYPELVQIQEDGTLVVAYDKLSVIALAAIDKLHEENQKLKERLIILETKLN